MSNVTSKYINTVTLSLLISIFKMFSRAILIIYLNVMVTYNYIYITTPCYPSTPSFVIWIDIIIQ